MRRSALFAARTIVGSGGASPAAGDGAAGHDADEVSTVLGAGVDVGVEAGVGDRDVLDRVWSEGFGQRSLHLGDAEDAGPGTGHRDAHDAAGWGDEHADDRVARGGVAG